MVEETHYELDPQRKRKRPDRKPSSFETFMEWVAIPSLLGMAVTIFLGRVLVTFIGAFASNQQVGLMTVRAFNRALYDMKATLMGDFSSNMWLMMLFGALVGTFVKYTFSDKRD